MKKVKISGFAISLIMAVLFILSCFSFSPITANASNYTGDYISISYEVNDDGEVIWSLDFGLNTDKRGLQEDEKATYRVNVQLMLRRIAEEKEQELLSIYSKNPVEEYNPEGNIKYSSPIYDQKTDSAGFKIKYSSQAVYNFYTAKEGDINERYENLFITKQVKQSVFPFAEVVDGETGKITLAQYYRNQFISACQGLSIATSITTYNPQFIYDYSASTNRIKSNADLTFTDANGKYHYAWGEAVNNINSSFVMSLTLTTANRGWWYLLAIALPLVIMFAVIIVIKIKEKKGKQEVLPN